MKLKELPQVMALSTAEKLALIQEIEDSIESEISDEEKKLLDERWEQYLAHPETALTLEQLKAAVDSRLK
jgi:putative addiction module component (TIGR02574 family)